MGSRLFHTLVGVGISLGMTSTGCLGQSREADGSAAPAVGGSGGSGGSGGLAEGASTTAEVQVGSATSTSNGSSATEGTTAGNSNTNGDSGAIGSGGRSDGVTGGSSETVTSGGGGGGNSGGGGAEPGTAGQGGDGPDPFCDTSWPTTKGNPPVPECADPEHECRDELPVRCFVPKGEFACDGDFERAYAPLCVDGTWQCESGLVPATECHCFTRANEQVCTGEGAASSGGR